MTRKAAKPTDARSRWTRVAEDHGLDLVFFDPPAIFDAAIIGIVYGNGQEPAVLYDEPRVLAALIDSGMSAEDADDWFHTNTIGVYLGEATPRFLGWK